MDHTVPDTELIAADVVVVGAGPAGIAAAVRASGAGARTVLVDEGFAAGGQIWRQRNGHEPPRAAREWLNRLAHSSARVLSGVSVIDVRRSGAAHGHVVVAERDGALVAVSAPKVVLATGARELWIPFPGWTLPGVMGIGGAQALLKSGASVRGKRAVIVGSGPLMLPVAASLARAGARLVLVAEQSRGESVRKFAASLWSTPGLLAQAARYRAAFALTPYRTGTWVVAASGDDHVRSVTLSNGRETWSEDVELVCTGYGLVPSTELARLAGCGLENGCVRVDAAQRTTADNILACGETTGIGGAPLAIAEGEIAGLAAASIALATPALMKRRDRLRADAERMAVAFAPRPELRSVVTPATVVCRCEDVTYGALCTNASSRQAKLYTRAGMGACQGRVCGASLQFLLGWQPDTVRSPVEPALVSTLSMDVAADVAPPASTQSEPQSESGDSLR